MQSIIAQAVALPAPAETLYKQYLDSGKHSALTGNPATIDATPGGSFAAFNGVLTGQIIHLVPGKLIVQTWRSTNFPDGAIDSILTLTFSNEGNQGRIELVQVNVPNVDYAGVSSGWHKFYWTPWREYLSQT